MRPLVLALVLLGSHAAADDQTYSCNPVTGKGCTIGPGLLAPLTNHKPDTTLVIQNPQPPPPPSSGGGLGETTNHWNSRTSIFANSPGNADQINPQNVEGANKLVYPGETERVDLPLNGNVNTTIGPTLPLGQAGLVQPNGDWVSNIDPLVQRIKLLSIPPETGKVRSVPDGVPAITPAETEIVSNKVLLGAQNITLNPGAGASLGLGPALVRYTNSQAINNIPATADARFRVANELLNPSQPRPFNPSDKANNGGSARAREVGDAAESIARTSPPGPLRTAASLVAGERFQMAGDPEKAQREYQRVLDQEPDNERARTGHALSLAEQGRADEARKEASAVLARDPKNAVASLIAGHGVEPRSASLTQKLSKLASGLWSGAQSEKLGGQAQTGGRSFELSDGAPTPGSFLDSHPISGAAPQPGVFRMPKLSGAAFTHYQGAFGKMQVHDMTGALFEATASINDAPNSAAPWVLRSYIDNRLEPVPNSEGAKSDAGKALKIEPQNAAAMRERALAQLNTGQVAQAMQDLASAIQLEPKNGTGYLYRAMVEEKIGKSADAVADYGLAASLDPALQPFSAQAVARLGTPAPGPESSSSPSRQRLMRGGLIALSLLLILAGMLGTEAGRKLVTRRAVITTKGARFDGTLPPSRALSAGDMIGGNYRVVKEIGRGGMGVVFEAFDAALQRRVAVKQLQRVEDSNVEDLERFLREARLVAKLRHPRLVEIHNVVNEGDLFLVFEYMDGLSLDKVLSSRLKLPPAQALQALADVGAAVDYAHGQKVIHRDLKPGNVMVERDGRCKVMDFGIAHQSQTATFLTQTAASGTPPYMAPEQSLGSVSKASDLYAMGVMAYEMLTGRRPFRGPDFIEQKLRREFEPVAGLGLPSSLDAFFQKALEPDPTKRFASGADLAAGFRAAFASQPV